MQKLDVFSDEADPRASTRGAYSIDDSHPFAFSKTAMTREQLNELFSPDDFKKLRIAQKLNSQPFVNGGQVKKGYKSNPISKRKTSLPSKHSINNVSSGNGLVLDTWPHGYRKTSVNTLNHMSSTAKNDSYKKSSGMFNFETAPSEYNYENNLSTKI